MIKTCEYCGKEYKTHNTHNTKQICCSFDCSKKLQASKSLQEERVCPICRKVFHPLYHDSKYCSAECKQKGKLAQYAANNARRKAERQLAKSAKQSGQIKTANRTLAEWCALAAECNMDYGNYRMQIERFGKTHEELKIFGARAGLQNTGSHVHKKTR